MEGTAAGVVVPPNGFAIAGLAGAPKDDATGDEDGAPKPDVLVCAPNAGAADGNVVLVAAPMPAPKPNPVELDVGAGVVAPNVLVDSGAAAPNAGAGVATGAPNVLVEVAPAPNDKVDVGAGVDGTGVMKDKPVPVGAAGLLGVVKEALADGRVVEVVDGAPKPNDGTLLAGLAARVDSTGAAVGAPKPNDGVEVVAAAVVVTAADVVAGPPNANDGAADEDDWLVPADVVEAPNPNEGTVDVAGAGAVDEADAVAVVVPNPKLGTVDVEDGAAVVVVAVEEDGVEPNAKPVEAADEDAALTPKPKLVDEVDEDVDDVEAVVDDGVAPKANDGAALVVELAADESEAADADAVVVAPKLGAVKVAVDGAVVAAGVADPKDGNEVEADEVDEDADADEPKAKPAPNVDEVDEELVDEAVSVALVVDGVAPNANPVDVVEGAAVAAVDATVDDVVAEVEAADAVVEPKPNDVDDEKPVDGVAAVDGDGNGDGAGVARLDCVSFFADVARIFITVWWLRARSKRRS